MLDQCYQFFERLTPLRLKTCGYPEIVLFRYIKSHNLNPAQCEYLLIIDGNYTVKTVEFAFVWNMNMATLDNLDPILNSMATHIKRYHHDKTSDQLAMIGIHTGGVWIAERLHNLLGLVNPLGKLNINFYRDDFSQFASQPTVKPSNLPTAIDEKHIILVDDVIYTGRTIKAALNELFDYGRPASVMLAVLVERGGRELPIQPDVIGCVFDLDTTHQVKLNGPEPLTLEICPRNE